jgi:hypothetical protein
MTKRGKLMVVCAVALYSAAAVVLVAAPRAGRWMERAQSRAAQPVAAAPADPERLERIAQRLLRGAELARVQRSVMRGYPEAEAYFTGRAEAFAEAAEVVMGLPPSGLEGGAR